MREEVQGEGSSENEQGSGWLRIHGATAIVITL